MKQWLIVATILLQDGSIEELPATRRFEDAETCNNQRADMLVAYDLMIAQEQSLADHRCTGSHARDRCGDEEFRHAVPWILLGDPHCGQVPTQ